MMWSFGIFFLLIFENVVFSGIWATDEQVIIRSLKYFTLNKNKVNLYNIPLAWQQSLKFKS